MLRVAQAELYAAREERGGLREEGGELEYRLKEALSALQRERVAREAAEAELEGVAGELRERRATTYQLEGALRQGRESLEGRVGDLERKSVRLFDSREEAARECDALRRQMAQMHVRGEELKETCARRVEEADRQVTLSSSRCHELERELRSALHEAEAARELGAGGERERRRAEALLDVERLASAELRATCIRLEGASADARSAEERCRAAMAEARMSAQKEASSLERALEAESSAKAARADADERSANNRVLSSRLDTIRAELEAAKDAVAAGERRLLLQEQAAGEADARARELANEVGSRRIVPPSCSSMFVAKHC